MDGWWRKKEKKKEAFKLFFLQMSHHQKGKEAWGEFKLRNFLPFFFCDVSQSIVKTAFILEINFHCFFFPFISYRRDGMKSIHTRKCTGICTTFSRWIFTAISFIFHEGKGRKKREKKMRNFLWACIIKVLLLVDVVWGHKKGKWAHHLRPSLYPIKSHNIMFYII